MEENQIIQSLEAASFCAMRISGGTQGRGPASWHAKMASLAFARLALNGLSILRLSLGNSLCLPVNGLQIWDLPSVSSLSRNLIETYLVLHYFTKMRLPAIDSQFREAVWEYHGTCERVKMLRSGVPCSAGLPELEQRKLRLKQELERSPHFENLPRNNRQRILHGEISKLETNEDLCASAGVSRNYYRSTFKYGSNHTHASPFSFAEMDSFRADDPSASRVFDLALQVSTGFIALGIRDYIQLYPEQMAILSEREKRLIVLWEGVLQWETGPHFAQHTAA